MPVHTYVEDGQLVGYLPGTPYVARVPLREIMGAARAELTAGELDALDRASGDTVGAVLDEVGAGKAMKKLKKVVKAVAKSKIVKGLVNVVKKAVPPPFNLAVKAAEGAVKLGKALASKSKKPAAVAQKKKAKAIVPAVRAAAAGKISTKKLTQIAKKKGVKPKVAQDAALIKRVAMDARTNPKAAATLRLAKDLTSTRPSAKLRLSAAVTYGGPSHEPTTSREEEEPIEAPLEEPMTEEDQEPMTADPYGPDEVPSYELEQGDAVDTAAVEDTEGADAEGVEDAYDGYVEGAFSY
jgi:hypothetical protein